MKEDNLAHIIILFLISVLMMKSQVKNKLRVRKDGREKSSSKAAGHWSILKTKMWPIFIFRGLKKFSKKELYGIYKYKWGYPYTSTPKQVLCERVIELGGLSIGIKYYLQEYPETRLLPVEEMLDAESVPVDIR